MKVHTLVFLGHPDEPDWEGLGLRVKIEVEGCDADEVIMAAHEVRGVQFTVFQRPEQILTS